MSLGRGSLSEEGLPVSRACEEVRRSRPVGVNGSDVINKSRTGLSFVLVHYFAFYNAIAAAATTARRGLVRRAARGDIKVYFKALLFSRGHSALRALVQMLKLNTASPEGALRIWLGRVCCEVSKSFLLRFTLIYPFQHYRRLRPERPRASHFKNTHARTAGRVPLRRMTGSLPGIWLA
jgi:hypothetical protein